MLSRPIISQAQGGLAGAMRAGSAESAKGAWSAQGAEAAERSSTCRKPLAKPGRLRV
ncbi:MAG: hypothetical protein ACRYGK_09475 [Janthinobacterium lividum]